MAYDSVVDSNKLNNALTETANAIREKIGSTEFITFDETEGFKRAVESIDTETRYNQGYEDGKNSVVQVERYVNAITFDNLNLFGKEEIVFNLDCAGTLYQFYLSYGNERVNNTVKHITINCPNQVSSMRESFYGTNMPDYYLEHITLNVDTSKSQWWMYTFFRMQALKTIDGTPLNLISVNNNGYSSMFGQCGALKDVRFVENSIVANILFSNCPNLSAETKQSIFDGLATVDTAQTLTLHANLKILQSQVDSANAKGWTVAGGVVVSEEEYYAE